MSQDFKENNLPEEIKIWKEQNKIEFRYFTITIGAEKLTGFEVTEKLQIGLEALVGSGLGNFFNIL